MGYSSLVKTCFIVHTTLDLLYLAEVFGLSSAGSLLEKKGRGKNLGLGPGGTAFMLKDSVWNSVAKTLLQKKSSSFLVQ